MSISPLPLSYCTNVHPGRSVAEVGAGLDRYAAEVARRLSTPLAAGLWLSAPAVEALLAEPAALPRFADGLARRGLSCHTLNAFPYGDFHGPVVKRKVYQPDWTDRRRLDYTRQCARALSAFLPPGGAGSISTLPLGFKALCDRPGFADACADRLIELAIDLARLRDEQGQWIRLAIEPEPFCTIETTGEAIAFFDRLRESAQRAGAQGPVRDHLGVCFDVCHQAVEFEEVGESIRALSAAQIRINKLHVSCALQLDRPARSPEGRRALLQYVEPRYLHQTFARLDDGRVMGVEDLNADLMNDADFAGAQSWRVHFHVPVDAEAMGPLSTTRPALREALSAVARLDYAPDLEVETYTWEVLPDANGEGNDLVAGLARELSATHRLLDEIAPRAGQTPVTST